MTRPYAPYQFLIDAFRGFFSIRSMPASPNVSTEGDLRDARNEVLSVLRAVDPTFLGKTPDSALGQKHGEIAKAFLKWLLSTPFELEIVPIGEGKNAMYEGRWMYNGAEFVGFKQPPAAANREDAKILACAALLRNDWCRSRLPPH